MKDNQTRAGCHKRVTTRDHGLAPRWLLSTAGPLTMLCAALALSSLWSYYQSYRALLVKSWS